MASIPSAVGTNWVSTAVSFVANLAANYLVSRALAQDGPRLDNLSAAGGDYGIAMARAYGESVRLTGAFIAQADIDEDEHKVEDYSEISGAIGGAAAGFQIGGPIGAGVGAVVGGILGFATPDQKYYTYSDTFALFFLDRTNDDPIEDITKMWANGKLIFNAAGSEIEDEEFDADGRLIWRRYGGPNKNWRSMTVYTGHTDQPVDPTLADEQEISETGAYPYSAYAVIKDLELAPFGNSVPPIEALILVKSGETVAGAAEAICAAANIDPLREVSTTALVNSTLRGYSITAETTCWDALKPLLPVYAVDAAEVSGQVRFYRRTQSMRATIPQDAMGAYAYGDTPPGKFAFRRGSDLNLPQQTTLTWIDPDKAYQPNTATSRRSQGNAASNVNVSVQMVLTANEGASAAALMHWDAWLGRTQLGFTLTDAWIGIETGCAYALNFADQIVPYRITRKLRGANGIIEVEALSDESVTYTASVLGGSGVIPEEEDTTLPDTRLVLMDMSILEDGHDDYGFYIVMAASKGGWTRGRIEASNDGINFVTIIDSPNNTIVGDVTGTLAAGTTDGLDDTLDTTSVLTVVLLHDGMTLESATDAELDGYKNFCFVGKNGLGEYLQFKTATFVSGSTWQLTNLRRGRRGTDFAISTHASGEEFALLGAGGVFRIVYSDETDWGTPITFRGVTLHQDGADADEQTFTNTGEGKRPFSPVNVEGSWDGSYNLTATFDSRSRLFAGGLGIDDNAEWDVQITNATPVRNITVVAETFTYSAANQTTDGLTPGTIVEGRVRQTSDVNDGRWREFTLYGPLASTADSTLILADTTLLTADMG